MQNTPSALNDVKGIKQAISKPKDFNKLINIIAYRSNSYRQEIVKTYFENYNISIYDDLKSELSGKFQEAAISLFYTPVDFDCMHLRKAMKGLGTNQDTLIEIIATRSNQRIAEIKQRYPQLYEGRDLLSDIKKETSGFFRKILESLLEGDRPNNPCPDEKECEQCAKKLYEAGINKKDNLEDTYLFMFTKKSQEEFILITKMYYKWYSKTLFEAIESLFSGDVKKVLKTITYSLLSPSEYFAYRINKAITGFTTNDTVLTRVIVSRDEIDIERIKKYYKQLYNEELYTAINNQIKGDYKNLLLALIRK
jgi:hypothetical protein